MTLENLKNIINYIVDRGMELKNKYLEEETVLVDFVNIFSESEEENKELVNLLSSLGKVVEEAPTGPTFKLNEPMQTSAGTLFLVRARNYDAQKPQRGAPDFRIENYEKFKEKYSKRSNFNLLIKPSFEILELSDSSFDVLVYFPNIPLSKDLGL